MDLVEPKEGCIIPCLGDKVGTLTRAIVSDYVFHILTKRAKRIALPLDRGSYHAHGDSGTADM